MKTKDSLLVVAPLLERELGDEENIVQILDTLDTIAQNAYKVKQVVIYSDCECYLDELLCRCKDSSTFPGFPDNVTSCVYKGSIDEFITASITDFPDCTWVSVLEEGYFDTIPEELPENDSSVVFYGQLNYKWINSNIIPDPLDYQEIIYNREFMARCGLFRNYEDSCFIHQVIISSILHPHFNKVRAEKSRLICYRCPSDRLDTLYSLEGYSSEGIKRIRELRRYYNEAWKNAVLGDYNNEILDTLRDWMWNTLNCLSMDYLTHSKSQITPELIEELHDYLQYSRKTNLFPY